MRRANKQLRTLVGRVNEVIFVWTVVTLLSFHFSTACSAQAPSKGLEPEYVVLELPTEGICPDYLLLEMYSEGSRISGRAFYLSHVHHPGPWDHRLSLREIGDRLLKNQGSCLPLRGRKEAATLALETEELRIEYRDIVWRYRWSIKAELTEPEPDWRIHEDYWASGFGHFPEDVSFRAGILKEFPVNLRERKDCLPENAPEE
jgi:hypothetical protein